MAKKIIALTGEMGSGKDTVGRYLSEKCGAANFRFSDVLRTILGELEQPITRENLTKISRSLRDTFGEDVLAQTIAQKVAKVEKGRLIVIDGIRRELDLELFRKENLVLVYIEVPLETRFERILKRGQNEDEHTKTLEEFQRDHQLETEVGVRGLKEKAQFVIDNNGSLEELHLQLDDFLKRTAL